MTFVDERSWPELLLACTVFFGGLTVLSNAAGFALERAFQKRGLRIFAVPLKRGQLRTELLGNVLFLAVFAPAITALLASGAVRFASGWLAELLTFFVSWSAFVVFYYFFHRAMHTKALFWMHRWHHESLVTTPLRGLSMHPLEAVGWCVGLLVPGLVLSWLGLLGFYGWLAFFAVHFSGNIVGHANAELFPNVTRSVSVLSNAITYHSLHHARFDGHYGFANALMDRLFGTEFSDWCAILERVKSGKPLETPRERG